jgi:hypothetical protein
MAHVKRAVTYGPEYEELLIRAYEVTLTETEYTLHLKDHATAVTLQQKVYGYFRSLRLEGLRPDLVQRCELLSMHIVGNDLEFFRRANSWDAKLLREQLGLDDDFAAVNALPLGSNPIQRNPQENLVEKLTKVRAEREKK